MNKMKMSERIGRLAELAAEWETHEAIDPLERDLALEMLRGLYSDIKFGKPAAAEPCGEPVCGVPASEPGIEPVCECSPEPETEAAFGPEPEPLIEPKVEEPAASSTEPDTADSREAAVIPENSPEENIPEPVVYSASEPEPAPMPEPQPATEPAHQPAPAEEAVPVRHRRVDPDVIRSLYGDDSPAAPVREEPAPQPGYARSATNQPAQAPAQEAQQTAQTPQTPQTTQAAQAAQAQQVPASQPSQTLQTAQPSQPSQAPQQATLGDVMNAGRQTLGETLRNGEKDMAAKIAAAEHPDLRQSIGINDKFLMVRDMFAGDAEAFASAIAHLDTFTDLDEAIIYIHDTYDWSADSDGVKLLVELLERKLG